MRSAREVLVVVVSAVLWAASAGAQVEWGELFPEEGSLPLPPPRPPAAAAQKPAAPARPAPPAAARPAPGVSAPQARPAPAEKMQARPAPAEKAPAPSKPAASAPAPREPAVQAIEEAPPAAAPRQARAAATGMVPLADLGLAPGEVIDESNLTQFTHYMSPGLEWGIRYGWKLEAIEAKHIEAPREYREATEKYSGQVTLSARGQKLENYIAGMPFPRIDPADPDIAMKIMWNYYYGWGVTDDLDARYFDADTGSIAKGQNMEVERHYIVDHLRRLHYNGRLYVAPTPELPNPEGFRYKESLHPLLEPFDLKGVGGTFYRYLDPSRQDDSWLYLPQLRRVRRLSTAQRSDALFGQDTDIDSYYGYNGHIAWNDYQFLGEQVILAAMHARHAPVKWQEPEDFFFADVWEPRRVWVIEAKSKFPQYAYGKRILFIDKESYVIPYSDIYDRTGQLWKIWVNMWSFKREAVPGAKLSVYSDDRAFAHAVIMLDTQLAHATKAALPSTKSRGEECIFINMGDKTGTTEDFFTVAHLIAGGH